MSVKNYNTDQIRELSAKFVEMRDTEVGAAACTMALAQAVATMPEAHVEMLARTPDGGDMLALIDQYRQLIAQRGAALLMLGEMIRTRLGMIAEKRRQEPGKN